MSLLGRAALAALLPLAVTGCGPKEPPPAPAAAPEVSAPDVSIPHTKYELDNGLDVILAPDDSVPFVWVNLWYAVGSKDEVPGRTGFAHLFEHLMFQGSENYNDDYFKPLQAVGARINGTTSFDRTNYFEGCRPSSCRSRSSWRATGWAGCCPRSPKSA